MAQLSNLGFGDRPTCAQLRDRPMNVSVPLPLYGRTSHGRRELCSRIEIAHDATVGEVLGPRRPLVALRKTDHRVTAEQAVASLPGAVRWMLAVCTL